MVKSFSTKKPPGLCSSTEGFYQRFKEKIPNLHKLFRKLEEEGTRPNSPNEGSPERDITGKYRPITLLKRYKISQQSIRKSNPAIY